MSALARLVPIEKSHGAKSVEELEQEITELKVELSAFRRKNARVREDAVEGIQISITAVEKAFEETARNCRLA